MVRNQSLSGKKTALTTVWILVPGWNWWSLLMTRSQPLRAEKKLSLYTLLKWDSAQENRNQTRETEGGCRWKVKGMEGKAIGEELWFLNRDKVQLVWLVHAVEIPSCCWLLQYINSIFYFEPGTWRIDGIGEKEKKPDGLQKGTRSVQCKTSTVFYKKLWKPFQSIEFSLHNALSVLPVWLGTPSSNPVIWVSGKKKKKCKVDESNKDLKSFCFF